MRAAVLGVLLAACGGTSAPAEVDAPTPQAPAAEGGPHVDGWSRSELRALKRLRLDTTLPPDPTNRWADDPAAAALGRALFHDPGLSPSGQFSCATCHVPDKHFTDGLPKAQAAGTTARHTPGIEGSQLGPWFFWDGRADSLWAQAAGPIESDVEMDSDRLHVARHVLATYAEAYAALFGDMPSLPTSPDRARPGDGPLGEAWDALPETTRTDATRVFVNALKAIAAYERTLVPQEAPFDRFVDAVLAGDATGGGELSDAAVRGLRFFVGRGQCVACHTGPFFTDRAFHALGLPLVGGYDPGRTVGARQVLTHPFRCGGDWADTSDCEELRFLDPAFDDFQGAFKTPSLRNVAATGPYMHDGSMPSLEAVLAFYSELPGAPVVGHRELTLQPLNLSSDEIADVIAFLGALEGPLPPGASAPDGAQ